MQPVNKIVCEGKRAFRQFADGDSRNAQQKKAGIACPLFAEASEKRGDAERQTVGSRDVSLRRLSRNGPLGLEHDARFSRSIQSLLRTDVVE